MIKARRIKQAGHVACMGDKKSLQNFGWKAHTEVTTGECKNVRIILQRIFRIQSVSAWSGFIWLRIGTGGGLF
jgi:hypothetical protein